MGILLLLSIVGFFVGTALDRVSTSETHKNIGVGLMCVSSLVIFSISILIITM